RFFTHAGSNHRCFQSPSEGRLAMRVPPNIQVGTSSIIDDNPDLVVRQPMHGTLDSKTPEKLIWELPEEHVIARLQTHDGPVVVDLDETLYLHNSTEEFIGLAVPGLIAAYVLRLLDLARPWRWTGGPKCRD